MKQMKRIFAFAMMLCLLMLCVAPTAAVAAPNYKGKTQKFLIRNSGSYSSTGVWVTMRSTSADGKTGTITFNSTLTTKKLGNAKILKGIVYNYTISSLKEDGKITLKYDVQKSDSLLQTAQLHTITGKIHIDKSKGCAVANIWKIDTLRYNNSRWNKLDMYFRNN